MSVSEQAGRANRPDLKEMVSHTDDLKELLEAKISAQREIMDERDRRYEDHFRSMDETTRLALNASEKAVNKADIATEKRFDCVSSDTPILCTDLIWREAGLLKVGDELVAFDEESLSRRGRRYRKAIVTANSLAIDDLLTVSTSQGNIRCNAKHPWLVRRTNRSNWQWVATDALRAGDTVMRPLDVWPTNYSWESGWLAGMYDGEGCLSLGKGRIQLSITQRESATSERIGWALNQVIQKVYSYRVEAGKDRRTCAIFHFIVGIRPDILKLLGSIRPPRLLATSEKAWLGQVVASHGRVATVIGIDKAGKGMIANLSTSTHTYVAGGFAMHNSVNEFRGSLKDQAATLLPREEADAKFKAIESKTEEIKKDIISLREYRSEGGGKEYANQAALDQKQFDIRTLLSVVAILISVASALLAVTLFILRQKP